jgi:predicted nucleic acid-binding protein
LRRFFDSSAIVAAYAKQSESAKVRRLLAQGGAAVSRLAEVEIVSAFCRLGREAAMAEEERNAAIEAFTHDLETWEVIEVTTQVTAVARTLLQAHPVRASDAIQLGSALVLQSRLAVPLDAFVAFDARLLAAARAEQLAVHID